MTQTAARAAAAAPVDTPQALLALARFCSRTRAGRTASAASANHTVLWIALIVSGSVIASSAISKALNRRNRKIRSTIVTASPATTPHAAKAAAAPANASAFSPPKPSPEPTHAAGQVKKRSQATESLDLRRRARLDHGWEGRDAV